MAKATQPQGKTILAEAIKAIDSGKIKKVVTNANVTPDTKILSGVTQNLKNQGIEFLNVF